MDEKRKNKILNSNFAKGIYMKTETTFDTKRQKGLELRNRESNELVGPYDRPKSRGRTYDIPRADGTYTEDQVDQEGGDYDLNSIMKRLDPSGRLFNKAVQSGMTTDAGMLYGDFTTGENLQEALNTTIHAEQQFALLPVEMRNRFENDPVKFLNYIHDPSMLEEQYKLGIRVKTVVPETDATNKDVITAIRESAKAPKKAPKGGDSED